MTSALELALSRLRSALQAVHLYLPLPSTPVAQDNVNQVLDQLDDYVLPRLRELRAPLLVIVGGSTGAGKSTLVNSIIGHPVSATGVIRPTTRSPVLIHHPDDAEWFADDRILPGLPRSSGAYLDPHTLRTVPDQAMPRGMAILDAPDIDSVDAENRALAAQLLSAGDLWLFITSATRYADAVPWSYLNQAVERSAAVAVVLDRVPPAAMAEVPAHLAAMMTERGLGNSPFFAVPETVTDDQGMLPKAAVEPIRGWLAALAADQRTRTRVVMKTLDGAIASLAGQMPLIAQGLDEQVAVIDQLRQDAVAQFVEAIAEVNQQTRDGILLRNEVLSRWQDYVGTGELMRSLESRLGRWRDRLTNRLKGEPIESDNAKLAVESGLEALLFQAGQVACERAEAVWQAHPVGRFILSKAGADLSRPSPDFAAECSRTIRTWQAGIMSLVSEAGSGKRVQARLAALGVNAVGVSLMLVAFSHTGGLVGAEIGIAGGTAVVAQKVLELVFGDEAVRQMAKKAKDLLDAEIKELMSDQLARFTAVLEALRLDAGLPNQLRDLANEVEQFRSEELVELSLQTVLTPIERAQAQSVEAINQPITGATPAPETTGSTPRLLETTGSTPQLTGVAATAALPMTGSPSPGGGR